MEYEVELQSIYVEEEEEMGWWVSCEEIWRRRREGLETWLRFGKLSRGREKIPFAAVVAER